MRRYWTKELWLVLLIGALLYSLWQVGFFDQVRLSRLYNVVLFVGEMIPPDADVLPYVIEATYETVLMAFAGTMIGGVLALLLAMLSSGLLFPFYVRAIFRAILGLIRAVPALLWAMIFVIVFGFGPMAGVIAISAYTIGYLGKLFYEAFDSVSLEVLEAVRGVGATRLQLLRYAIIPETANYVISQLLFIFEYNVRASSIVGLVGAGGIGYLILSLVQSLRYDGLLTCILVMLAFVIGMDCLSSKIRQKYLK